MFPVSSRIKLYESSPLSYMPEKGFGSLIKYLININRGIKTMYDNKEISDDEVNFAATCFCELGNMLKRMVEDGQT